MSGQMKKYNYSRYYESIKNMTEPIMPSQLPHVKCSISEIISYAHKKGVQPYQLSDDEKKSLLHPY